MGKSAVSLIVNCTDQDEIDHFWDKLSAVPEAEQCGWIKDKYGVSWLIVPENLEEFMAVAPAKMTPGSRRGFGAIGTGERFRRGND